MKTKTEKTEMKPSETTKPRAFADFSPDEQTALLKRYVAGGHEELPMLAPAAIKGIVREYLIAKGHRDVPMVAG
jgi:hypothetical protein